MKPLRIAAFGDMVSPAAVALFEKKIGCFKRENQVDFVIVNGENAAKGNGLDPDSALSLRQSGADVVTGGNHTLRRFDLYPFLDDEPWLIRPINYPDSVPGMGYVISDTPYGRIMVINVMGCVYMDSLNSPFDTVDRLLTKEKGNYDLCVMDVHGEATSEKAALAHYFDGRIDAIFGTHTHVQTSDIRILKRNTGFITDLGMCGPVDSILGVDPQKVIDKFRTKLPTQFKAASGPCSLEGALFTLQAGKGCIEAKSFRIHE